MWEMSDSRNDFMDAMGVLGTIAVGALIGAGVALLMAPKSGAELRQDIITGAERLESEFTDAQHKATNSVKAQVEKLQEKASELTRKAEELTERLTKHTDDTPATDEA